MVRGRALSGFDRQAPTPRSRSRGFRLRRWRSRSHDGRQLVVLLEVLVGLQLRAPAADACRSSTATLSSSPPAGACSWSVRSCWLGAIALGLSISFTVVAVAGGLWNMEHTLMQRYGFVRIYGRRTGEDDGRLERDAAPLVARGDAALRGRRCSHAGADRRHCRSVALNGRRARRAGVLVAAYALVLLVPSAVVAAALTAALDTGGASPRPAGTANRPKQLYRRLDRGDVYAFAVLVDPVAGTRRLRRRRTPSSTSSSSITAWARAVLRCRAFGSSPATSRCS